MKNKEPISKHFPEMLDESQLENVTGGHNGPEGVIVAFAGGSILCLPGIAVAARAVTYRVKSAQYEKSGNTKKALEYAKKSQELETMAVALLSLPLPPTVIAGACLADAAIKQAKKSNNEDLVN